MKTVSETTLKRRMRIWRLRAGLSRRIQDARFTRDDAMSIIVYGCIFLAGLAAHYAWSQ